MKLITDLKTTGSLRMFRLHLTKKYHICFMRNLAYMNGSKGYHVTLMRKYREEGTYTPIIKLLNFQY